MSSADRHEQARFNSASPAPAVEDCEFFREDLFRKKLMDLAGHPHATTCCPITGTLATMLKTHVYLHSPQYGYMRAYLVQFVSIVKKQVVIKVPTNELLALTNDDILMGGDVLSEWLSDTNAKDGNLFFQSISWADARSSYCHSVISQDGSPTLSVLMSDGNLIFFDRCHGSDSYYELAVSSSYYHLRLYGVRVLFDPTVDYMQWCLRRPTKNHHRQNSTNIIGIPPTVSDAHVVIRDRIRCYCLQSFIIGSEGRVTTILVVGSCNCITVWRVLSNAVGDSGQHSGMVILGDRAIDPNMEYGVDTPLPTALSMHVQGSRSVEELSFTLLCSTSRGDVLMFRIDISLSTTEELAAIISGPSNSLSIFRTPIDRMAPLETPSPVDHRLAFGLVVVTAISGSRSALIAVDISRHRMQLCQCITAYPPTTSDHYQHCTTITGWVDLPSSCEYPRGVSKDFDPQSREVLASFSNGLLQHYQYTLIPCDGDTVSYSMSLFEWGEDSIKLSTFMFGIAVDPLGLMCPYLQKVSANLSHSRESQLNLALTKPHCDLMFQLCPQINDQFAGSPLLLSKILSYAINHSSAKCFSFLPLAFLSSLEQCRAIYREGYQSPDAADDYHNDGINGSTSIIHDKEEDEVSVESDDDGSSVDAAMQEDSDSSSSVGDYSGVTEKSPKGVPPSRQRRVVPRARRRTSGLSSLYRSFLERKRPDSASLVVLSTRNLLIAALVVSQAINSSSGQTAEEECCSIEAFSAPDWTLSDPSITQLLLSFPSDPLLLRKKVRLWQCVHLTLLAGHKTRDVTVTEECRELLSRLRTCMSVAAAIASLQRLFGAGIDLDGVCDGTMSSLYFQAQLVKSFSPTTLSGDLQMSMNELCDAALASEAMRDMDRRRAALEHCAACGSSLLFDCNNSTDDCSRDASHLSSQCSHCGLTTERCCFSLRVITWSPETLPLELSPIIDNRQQDYNHRSTTSSDASAIVLSCPVCGAVTSLALLRDFHRMRDVGCETSNTVALCPFCTVWMLPI